MQPPHTVKMMIFERLRARSEARRVADSLYKSLSARSRDAVFFRDFNVPDTLDGRFDVLVFHAWLVLRELQRREERELAQVLVDQLFARLEEALRELGAGDIGLGRRMKAMTSAFYGRLEAYESAADVPALGTAIGRNLYRHADCDLETALSLARYAASAGAHLAQCRLEQGDVDFGALPALVAAQDTQP